MITIPNTYRSGSLWGYPLTHIVKMSVLSGSNTQSLYMTTHFTGSAAFSYSGVGVTLQDQYLAHEIVDGFGSRESIDGIGELDTQIDPITTGGCSPLNETELILLNQGRPDQDYRYKLESQDIEIWEGYLPPSGSVEVTTDFILRLRGVMKDVGEYDYTKFRIPIVDRRFIDNILIPRTKISRNRFPSSSAEVQGQVVPIILGNFSVQSPMNAGETYAIPHHSGIPDAIPVIPINDDRLEFVVAEHQINTGSLEVFYFSEPYHGRITSPTATFQGSSLVTVSLNPSRSAEYDGVVYADVAVYPKFMGSSMNSAFTGSAGAYKALFDMNSISSVDITNATGGTASFALRADEFPSFGDYENYLTGYPLTPAKDFWIVVRGGLVAGSGNYVTYWSASAIASSSFTSSVGTVTTHAFVGYGWPDEQLSDRLNEYQYGFRLTNGTTARIQDFYVVVRLDVAGVTRYFNPDKLRQSGTLFNSKEFWEGVYRRYGITNDTREVRTVPETNFFALCSGAYYTAEMTRSNGYSVTSSIENPVYAIEWLLREKVGVPSSTIDTASFDALGNSSTGFRRDWSLASWLGDVQYSLEAIGRMAWEHGMILHVGRNGLYKLTGLDPTGSAVYTVQSSSLATTNGIPMISLSETPNDSIVNEFNFGFRVDYKRGSTLGSVYVADTDQDGSLNSGIVYDGYPPRGTYVSDWLQESIDFYKFRRTLEDSFTSIRLRSTAERALRLKAFWLGFKLLKVSMILYRDPDVMSLELGDFIKINIDTIPVTHRDVHNFIVSRIYYPSIGGEGEPYVTIEAIEVPNADTGTGVLISRFISSEDLAT